VSEWDITSKQDKPNDASRFHIKNNIAKDGAHDSQGMVGLIVDSGKEPPIEEDKEAFL
jgi:hypothetical protein